MTRILPAGKLPNELLPVLLGTMAGNDPSVLVGPGVGEDAAVVDPATCATATRATATRAAGDLLAIKTDPITFATDKIGYYAVHVNANDIATTGAQPRWFLATLLLPLGTATADVIAIGEGISSAASSLGITVCGGHTEITSAVNRPVICGTMAGTVGRDAIKHKDSIRTGYRIVMTKSAGNEGTAILARERGDQLRHKGISGKIIDSAASFLDRLSILPEAQAVRSIQGVAALHDVTEGGVATALLELAQTSGCGLSVDLDAIPISPETRALCEALQIDPLGLIGSGSLLLAVDESSVGQVVESIEAEGIAASVIAEVTEYGGAVTAYTASGNVVLPRFDRDEIARILGAD
jgi:hydrogenase expression/formation protein HypE